MIKIQDLSFSYPDLPIFHNLSLYLPEVPVLALLGPSGSGKTTFLKLLIGLCTPESGKITGISSRRIGTVFQEDRLLPWRTASENITLAEPDPTHPMEVTELMERLGLSGMEGVYPKELSGGMQRRVAIARALYHSSDLILMDEPFKGLDPELKSSVMSFCRERATEIIFITHEEGEAIFLGADTLLFPLHSSLDVIK